MPLAQARELFVRARVSVLPVIAGGFVLGAVTRDDLERKTRRSAMNPPDNTEEPPLAEPARPLVLVVDDDEAIRESAQDLLEDGGFDTIGARHGLEALNLLAALPVAPAFILLDLMIRSWTAGLFATNDR